MTDSRSQPNNATPDPWSISDVRSVEGEYLIVAGEGHAFGLVASCPEKADAELIVSLHAQLADANDDVLRLHQEKMDQFERAIVAETRLANARKALEIARNMIRDKWIESAVIETKSMRSLGETLDAALKEIS